MAGFLAGCAGAVATQGPVEPAPESDAIAQLGAGGSLVIQRPTPGVALLSLWVDAGARDAALPQTALAAAYWAADKLAVSARVLAEGTEFSVLCATETEDVARCALRLIKVLDPAAPSATDAAHLRDRVREVRKRAAGDETRRAEQLALEALLGESAKGLFPFGTEADDARVDAAAVRVFIERNYARSRTLLLGLGDLKKGDLDSASKHLKERPTAQRERRLLGAQDAGLRVEAGGAAVIALTLATRGIERAASLCERFREIHGDAHANISSLRGATLAHLTLPAGELPFARLQSAVFDVRRLLLEPNDAPPTPPPDTLEGLARSIGEPWVARGEASRVNEAALGVALLWLRDDRAVEQAGALDKIKERAAAAIAAGMRNAAIGVHGASSAEAAHVTTDNGAELEVVRRKDERWFAATLRFAGGSDSDAATGHGRAALLATLMADGCGIASARGLDMRLSTLKAKLWPLVDADGLGVGISAPAEHTEEALDLLLRCGLRPSFQARAVEDARARLVRSLWQDEHRQLEAALAQLLTPAAPGTLAPWGTPAGVAKVETQELRRLHAQHAFGPGVSVWIAADKEPEQLARFVARRLAHLPATRPDVVEREAGPSTELLGTLVEDTRLRVLVGLRAASEHRPSLGAQVFASALEQALASRVGAASWSIGRATHALAFTGVALTVREDQLDGVQAQVTSALAALREKPDAFFRQALARAQLPRSSALSSARGWAEAAFAGRAAGHHSLNDELSVIRKLSKAQPSYFVLRPRP